MSRNINRNSINGAWEAKFMTPDYTIWKNLPESGAGVIHQPGDILMYKSGNSKHPDQIVMVKDVVLGNSGKPFAYTVVMRHCSDTTVATAVTRTFRAGRAAMYRYRRYIATERPAVSYPIPRPDMPGVDSVLTHTTNLTDVEILMVHMTCLESKIDSILAKLGIQWGDA